MDHLTLSERVSRVERILFISGFGDIATAVDRDVDKVAQHQERAGPSPKQSDQTAFEEIIQRISNCNDRVCLTADRLQKIGDRIMGHLPQNLEETCEGSQRSPEGTLEHTFMALNWLDASLSRLEQVALRMERV